MCCCYQTDNNLHKKNLSVHLQIDNKKDTIMLSIFYAMGNNMKLIDFLAKQPRGTAAEIARKLNTKLSNFSAWTHERKKVPIRHCLKIEKLTNGAVTRKDLRPDDWAEIWVELAEQPVQE